MNQTEAAAIPLGPTVIALVGEFDIADKQRLADAFEVAAQDPAVILDLSQTTFIDTTVLVELLKLRSAMAVGPGKLLVGQPTGSVWRVFDITQMGSVFEMRQSVEYALAELDLAGHAVTRLTLLGKERGR